MAKATKSKSHPANTESSGPVTAPWSTDIKKDGLKALTLPPTLKIADMPMNASIDVTIYDLVPSRVKSIKNPLALAINNRDQTKLAIPVVGGLAGSLLADTDDVDLSEVTKDDLAEGILGNRVVITKVGVKESKQWKDDSGNPRQYPIFEVAIAE